MPKLLTEFLGTMFLVLSICLASRYAGNLAPLAVGAMLIGLIGMGAHISAAHYNPAVTLAFLVRGTMSVREAWMYMLVQVLGAGAGAATAYALVSGPGVSPMVIAPGTGFPLVTAAACETLFTFILALVILNVATAPKTAGNQYFALAIGATVLAGVLCVAGISGAALNPAVGIGINVVAGKFEHLPLYIAAPSLGGALAGIVFRFQHPQAQ